jgi:hypothetical protein
MMALVVVMSGALGLIMKRVKHAQRQRAALAEIRTTFGEMANTKFAGHFPSGGGEVRYSGGPHGAGPSAGAPSLLWPDFLVATIRHRLLPKRAGAADLLAPANAPPPLPLVLENLRLHHMRDHGQVR